MKQNMPKEIADILIKAHDGKEPTESEKLKVRTYVGTLTHSVHHPVTGKEIPNPNPIEVDVSIHRPESLDDRVRRIMSVSSRIAAMNGFETAEEADDFDVDDVFDRGPVSPFEMVDHFSTMPDEQPVPVAKPEPQPASSGEADPTPEPTGEPV